MGKTFDPTKVGKVRGYPRDEAAYEARKAKLKVHSDAARSAGRLNRKGSPNGWRGRRDEVEAIRAAAKAGGRAVVAQLRPTATLAPTIAADGTVEVPESDDQKAALVLAEVAATALDCTVPRRWRTQAMRLFLTFTVPRPTAAAARLQLDRGMETAVAFLNRIAAEAQKENVPADGAQGDDLDVLD